MIKKNRLAKNLDEIECIGGEKTSQFFDYAEMLGVSHNFAVMWLRRTKQPKKKRVYRLGKKTYIAFKKEIEELAKYYTVREAAEIMGCSGTTAYRWAIKIIKKKESEFFLTAKEITELIKMRKDAKINLLHELYGLAKKYKMELKEAREWMKKRRLPKKSGKYVINEKDIEDFGRFAENEKIKKEKARSRNGSQVAKRCGVSRQMSSVWAQANGVGKEGKQYWFTELEESKFAASLKHARQGQKK